MGRIHCDCSACYVGLGDPHASSQGVVKHRTVFVTGLCSSHVSLHLQLTGRFLFFPFSHAVLAYGKQTRQPWMLVVIDTYCNPYEYQIVFVGDLFCLFVFIVTNRLK